MIVTTRKGKFIKQFSGPPEGGIVCFKFYQVVAASGCLGACNYCFLSTQLPYASGLYDVMGTLFGNLEELGPEARAWLKRHKQPAGLILGENQDGTCFEYEYKKLLGTTPLEILVPLFERENPYGHTLIVLSKFVSTKYAEVFGPARNVVFSWSLSMPSISAREEIGVTPLDGRLRKAAEMKQVGYRVRFRLDALAPIPNWREELAEIVGRINEIGPEMLTLGALRATNPADLRAAAARLGRDVSIFDHLVTIDRDGFKHRTADDFHVESFRVVKRLLDPRIRLGLCKEEASLWRSCEIDWDGCHCLHGRADLVAIERVKRAGLEGGDSITEGGAGHSATPSLFADL